MYRIIALLILISSSLHAQEITVGRTWDIVEPDPIEVAKERAANVNPKKLEPKYSFRDRLRAKEITRTLYELERTYTPSHTTETEIADKDGNVIYPAGFTYNPIQYMYQYNSRIIIIDEKDALSVKDKLKTTDIVILHNGDLTKASELLERRVSMLDLLTAESMNVSKVPVIITVDYQSLLYRLVEFNPDIRTPL
jgi:hypothetical protein